MDILNFISWIKGGRVVTTVDPTQTVLPVGLKDPKRDDNYLTGAITVEDFATNVVGPLVPTGPAGPQGVAGPAGVPGPVGPAGLNWQGAWVSGTAYVLDDAVGYAGASYFCINATSGTTAPNLDTTNWALLASQGAIGPQGPQGPTGAQGPSGNPIAWLEYNVTYKSVWNNGFNNVDTNTSFGDQAIANNSASASYNTGIGYYALRNNFAGQYNTAVGGTALVNCNSNNNTGVGYQAGFNTQSSAGNNTYVGAFTAVTSAGGNNTGVGTYALSNNATGNNNAAFGYYALLGANASSSSDNTAMGAGSMQFNTTGGSNTAVGSAALQFTSTGTNNVGMGYGAGNVITTGGGNTLIGTNAQPATSATNFSVAIGVNSLAATGSIAIGSNATTSSFTNSIALGIGATATGNNQFVVGSSTQAAGTVTTETVSSTRTWTVVINGTTHKILLA